MEIWIFTRKKCLQ